MYVGQKLRLGGEVQRYTCVACSKRFGVFTKPFNLQKTYIYTLVDLEKKVRGAAGMIFGPTLDLSEAQGALKQIVMLERGKQSISYRNRVDLTKDELEALSLIKKEK